MQEELIQEFKNGNRKAGDNFYNANIGLVYLAIKKYGLKSMDPEETIALVNQAFAKTMKIFDSTKGEFSTYFMIIAKGHILRHFRDYENIIKSRRDDYVAKITIPCDSLDKVIFSGDSADVCLKDTFGVEDDQSQVIVNEALERVSERDRKIFKLYHEAGLLQEEIGEILGVTQVQISRRISKTKTKLRSFLKEVC